MKAIKIDPTASTSDLLKSYASILDELIRRGVIRTHNNPVADYAEGLVAERLNLTLARNNKAGYDATNTDEERFQIKCRRIIPTNKSRQLGVIRNLALKHFDFLIGVLFNKNFIVKEAYKIPHQIIQKYAQFKEHQNGHILHLRGDILKDQSVENITRILRESRI